MRCKNIFFCEIIHIIYIRSLLRKIMGNLFFLPSQTITNFLKSLLIKMETHIFQIGYFTYMYVLTVIRVIISLNSVKNILKKQMLKLTEIFIVKKIYCTCFRAKYQKFTIFIPPLLSSFTIFVRSLFPIITAFC